MVPRQASSTVADTASMSRMLSLAMIYYAQSGHPGGCLSLADIASAIWSDKLLPLSGSERSDRNRFILSKGHSVPVLYALGYLEGLIEWEEICSFRQINSRLQGHPDSQLLPWLETSTGSLGQGISVACGLALGMRLEKSEGTVFTVLGDGELQEGQVWESAMFASHHGLGNLIAVVDRNGLQSDAATESIIAVEPLSEKWRSFGWDVEEIDGHSVDDIRQALEPGSAGIPKVIIADTVKGKGVPFMEGAPTWHGSVAMTALQLKEALQSLGATQAQIDKLLRKEKIR